jgi:ABC-2 type transport system permease protein
MLREVQLLVLTLLVPAAFVVITALGYGNVKKLPTSTVLVLDRSGLQATAYIQQLQDQHYADGRSVFNLKMVANPADAEELLKAQKAALLLTFSRASQGNVMRTVRGDATSAAFITGSTALEAALQPQAEKLAGLSPVIALDSEPLGLFTPETEFDAYAPGMMVFAILMLIPQTAMLIGRELRWGTLRRLQLSPLKTWELFLGIALAQGVVAVVQVVVMFLTARLVGYHAQGSLLAAILIGLVLSAGSIGMGLVLACFISNDSEALNTGGTVSMLQVFLSGAFFAINGPVILKISSYAVGPFDLLPATHAMQALQQVLTGGASLLQVGFRVTATAVLSVLYFMFGVVIFEWKRKQGRR